MTKRLSKKGQSMTLKDFYDKTPDVTVPIQYRLPSKPGVAGSASNLEHKLSDLSLASVTPQFSDKYSFNNTTTEGRSVHRTPGNAAHPRHELAEQVPVSLDKPVAYVPSGRSEYQNGHFGGVNWRADERVTVDSGVVAEVPYGYAEYASHPYPVPPPRQEVFYSGQAPPPPPPRVGNPDTAGSYGYNAPEPKFSSLYPPFDGYSQPPPPPPRRQPDQKPGVPHITTALASTVGRPPQFINSRLLNEEKPSDKQATKDQAGSRPDTVAKEKRKQGFEQAGPTEPRKQQAEATLKTVKPGFLGAQAMQSQPDSQAVETKAQAAPECEKEEVVAVGVAELEEIVPAATSNPWAEKLAAAALARMANTKSSLVAANGAAPAPPAAVTGAPAATVQAAELPAVVAVTKPAHPFERPRLSLKPRSVPGSVGLPASMAPSSPDSQASSEASAEGNRPKLNLLPRSAAVPAVDAVAAGHNGRPKLNLQPRMKSASGSPDGSPPDGASRAAAVFGGARPREEVLKERSVEVSSMGSGAVMSRTASLTSAFSEDVDNWQTVAGKKNGRLPGSAKDIDEGVFSFTASKGIAIQARTSLNGDYPFQGPTSYGSHGSSHALPRGSYSTTPDDDPVFRRALPLRQDPHF